MQKVLTLISIPIGNIEDITFRSLKAIFTYDYIVTEDTRNFIKLRNLLIKKFENYLILEGINKNHKPKLISYREQNHFKTYKLIISKINEGKSVGLMSDAGMPCISDPGYRLVAECLNNSISVTVIPGAVAAESCLAISGLRVDKYTFVGFLPKEKNKIKKIIEINKHNTIVYYESPYRLLRSMEIIAEIENFYVSACNDLTKKFEKIYRGKILEVLNNLKKEQKLRGEWSVVISTNNYEHEKVRQNKY